MKLKSFEIKLCRNSVFFLIVTKFCFIDVM